MPLWEMTETRKKMCAAVGHEVEVHLIDGHRVISGRCTEATNPLDNDPEVASIDIRAPGWNGSTRLIMITEDKIERIIIKD